MRRIILFYVLVLATYLSFGQEKPFDRPEVIPLPPEAAAMVKYGDIPVGHYTGVPNISIPLHVVKSGNISLPIDLVYQASAISVTQEATWVGLGWNLIAGGSINYVPVGGNDQTATVAASWYEMKKMFDYISKGNALPLTGCSDERNYQGEILELEITADALAVAYCGKGQKDIYSVNFLGHSFKFILHPKDNTPVFYGKKNKCKIKVLDQQGFEITSEDGTKYIFSRMDLTKPSNAIGYYQSWNLTNIISADGKYMVNLGYSGFDNKSINLLPSMNERFIHGHPTPSENGFKRDVMPYGPTVYNNYLERIETDAEIVYFDFDQIRPDIKGTGARRLTGIRIVDKTDSSVKKQYALTYDWFTSDTKGGNFLYDDSYNWMSFLGINEDHISKRLKLTALKRINPTDLTKSSEVYSFNYNETKLPYKTSFALDTWGYYNGEENKNTNTITASYPYIHTLLPGFLVSSIRYDMHTLLKDKNLWGFKGAFRGTSPDHITAGMLQSITYPTGGKTVFNFEPHTFDNYNCFSVTDEKSMMVDNTYSVSDFNNTQSQTRHVIDITSNVKARFRGSISKQGKYTGSQIQGATIRLWNVIPGNLDKTYTAAPDGSDKSWDEYIDLVPGKYVFECNSPDALGDLLYGPPVASGNLTLQYIDLNLKNSAKKMGGGVRIKEILNYDANNILVSTKKYSYEGGKLLTPLSNIPTNATLVTDEPMYGNPQPNGQDYWRKSWDVFNLLSDNFYGASISYIGNTVGYDKVTEKQIAHNDSIGKEIYRFTNRLPNIFYTIPIYDYGTNGDLLSHSYLNSASDTVKVIKNTYQVIASENWAETLNATATNRLIGNPDPKNDDFCFKTIAVYPNKSFWSTLTKTEVKDFFNNGAEKIITTKEYQYNLNNYLPKEVKEITSDNILKFTKFRYPHDLQKPVSGDIYTEMVNLNMINPVITATDSLQGRKLYSVKTNYRKFVTPMSLTNIIKPWIIESQFENKPFEERFIYELYDYHGNLLQFYNKDNITTSYLWSYNGSYPVAELVNGKFSSSLVSAEASYIGFESQEMTDNNPDNDYWSLNRSGQWFTTDSKVGRYAWQMTTPWGPTRSITPASPSSKYTFSGWARTPATFNGECYLVLCADGTGEAGYRTVSIGNTGGQWKYFQVTLDLSAVGAGFTTVSAYPWLKSGSEMTVDELRLHPSEGQMTTYTYSPLVGMSSKTDPNGVTTYYEYDSFGRLEYIRDDRGNILQKMRYNYSTQVSP